MHLQTSPVPCRKADRFAVLRAEGLFELKKIPGPGLCPVKGCRNKCGKKKGGLCDKHYTHRWRLRNPGKSAYHILKTHAKQRGHEFNLTFEYFCGMMDCAGAWDMSAESRGDTISIDRKDATKGYVPGNVRVVTVSENSAKGAREKYLPAVVQAAIQRKRAKEFKAWYIQEPESPF